MSRKGLECLHHIGHGSVIFFDKQTDHLLFASLAAQHPLRLLSVRIFFLPSCLLYTPFFFLHALSLPSNFLIRPSSLGSSLVVAVLLHEMWICYSNNACRFILKSYFAGQGISAFPAQSSTSTVCTSHNSCPSQEHSFRRWGKCWVLHPSL